MLRTWKELPRYWMTSLRSCVIGCWMGITPAGATPASFMSYGIAKRVSKNGRNFGKGEIEGVVAPETAAHAAGTAALLPMLSLGVPGSPTAAVLLGGLLIWGLQPGPMLFVEQKEFVWGLIASMYLGNLVGLIIVLTCVPVLAAILRIPFSIIAPVILVLCAIGAYTVHNTTFDVVHDDGVRRARLHAEEMQLPAGAARARDRARRQGGRGVPAVAAGLAGQSRRVLLQRPGLLDHDPRPDRAVLVGDPGGLHPAAGEAGLTAGRRPSGGRTGYARRWNRLHEGVWNIVFQSLQSAVTMDEFGTTKVSGSRPPARARSDEAHRLAIEPIDTSFSFKNKAYAALKNVIVSMDIYRSRSDIRLDERQLAQDFGISRTPVREAMAQLEREGFVRSVPRRGVYIVRKTKKEVIELITAWAALEGMAARLITQNADADARSPRCAACSRPSWTANCAPISTNIPRSISNSISPSSA